LSIVTNRFVSRQRIEIAFPLAELAGNGDEGGWADRRSDGSTNERVAAADPLQEQQAVIIHANFGCCG
jgi:hypothetical protein